MSLFQSLLAIPAAPPIPPSFDVLSTAVDGTGSAYVSTRQVALEPSVAGADRAMSWTGWIRCVNIGVGGQYVFTMADPASTARQYGLFVRSQTETGALNQHLQFVLFTNASNLIRIVSSQRFLKGRWYHVAITYSGSETFAGLNFYFNSVLDSTATKDLTGTYTGALNNATLRFNLSNVFAGSRFRGNVRDLAIWDNELSQIKITELYNEGVPFDVDTCSFYSEIEAYWPLHTDLVADNSVSFNLANNVGINFSSRPLSPTYPSISFQNARVGNTRYVAFGTALKNGNKVEGWIGSGTSHVVDTRIDKWVFDTSNLLTSTPVSWTDDVLNDLPDGLRGAQVGLVDGDLTLFTSQYNDVGLSFNDFGRYIASDGAVGEAFGAFISMESPAVGESINAYGNCIAGDAAGEHYVAYHEYTVASQTISVWKTTDDGSSWSKVNCFTGDSTKGYNEPCIIRVAPLTYIMLVREQAGAQISCSVTTDAFATMSAPVDSTLAVGTGMAAMCQDDDGNIVVAYADRGDGYGKVSLGNVVADILADPSDWNAGSSVFQTIDGTANILGYPFIINMGGGFFALGFSSEQNPPSATRTDFFVAYGAFGAG